MLKGVNTRNLDKSSRPQQDIIVESREKFTYVLSGLLEKEGRIKFFSCFHKQRYFIAIRKKYLKMETSMRVHLEKIANILEVKNSRLFHLHHPRSQLYHRKSIWAGYIRQFYIGKILQDIWTIPASERENIQLITNLSEEWWRNSKILNNDQFGQRVKMKTQNTNRTVFFILAT